MTNLKVAIGVFLTLLVMTFGVAAGTLEKIGLPVGKYLDVIKDKLSNLIETDTFTSGELSISLKTKVTDFEFKPKEPIDITLKSTSLNIVIGEVVINSTDVNVSISKFDGSLKYRDGNLELNGECENVMIDNTKLTKKTGSIKLHSEIDEMKIKNVRLSSLVLEPVYGSLKLGNMTIEVEGEKVKIYSFDGSISLKTELELEGTCSQVSVGNKIIK